MEKRLAHVKSERKETIINIYVKEFIDHIQETYMGHALRNRPLIDELKVRTLQLILVYLLFIPSLADCGLGS